MPAALQRGRSFERLLAAGGLAMVGILSISSVVCADHADLAERVVYTCPAPAVPCWPPLDTLQHLSIT